MVSVEQSLSQIISISCLLLFHHENNSGNVDQYIDIGEMSKLSQGNNDWSPSWYYFSTHQNIQKKYLNTDPAYPPSGGQSEKFAFFAFCLQKVQKLLDIFTNVLAAL